MKGKADVIRWLLLLLVAAGVYWGRDLLPLGGGTSELAPAKPVAALPAQTVRGYDKFTDARLVDVEGNDGDSFTVRAGGQEFVLRLYFIDAPESYLSDRYRDQRRRVEDQASDLGGISIDQAVKIGQEAKEFTRSALAGKPFTVYTYWERVYDDDRYYGFVELPERGYLGTELVRHGLARIHTKGPGSKEDPVPTPDGKSFHQHRDMLYRLEEQARKEKAGAWGE